MPVLKVQKDRFLFPS